MNAFVDELHNKKLVNFDNESFDEFDTSKSTKDKRVVIKKLDMLESLMKEYLSISECDVVQEYTTDELIIECFGNEFSAEDIDQFEEVLDDLTLNVDNSSKLLEEENRPSLVAIVAYSFENDIDLDEWIVDYFENNRLYFKNQKKNFLHMKNNLNEYLQRKEKMAV